MSRLLAGLATLSGAALMGCVGLPSSVEAGCEAVELGQVLQDPQSFAGRRVCFTGPITVTSRGVYFSKAPISAEEFSDVIIHTEITASEAIRRRWSTGDRARAVGVIEPVRDCFVVRPDGTRGCSPVRRPVYLKDSTTTKIP